MHSKFRTAVLGSILCAGLMTGPSLFAQDNPPPVGHEGGAQPMHPGMHRGPMSPDQELAGLTRALGLSTDQQTKLKPILEQRHAKLEQIHSNSSLSRMQKMQQMKALDDGANSKVVAVLDDAQKAKYTEMIEQRRKRMQQMRQMREQGEPGSRTSPGGDGGDAQPQ